MSGDLSYEEPEQGTEALKEHAMERIGLEQELNVQRRCFSYPRSERQSFFQDYFC